MEYKMCETDSGKYKIYRKRWFGWEPLDCCMEWCSWYGKKRPMLFDSEQQCIEFLKNNKIVSIKYFKI